jgi:hypothetical protein
MRRWEDTIKMDLRDIKREGVDWIHVEEWQALENTAMNFQVS